MPVCSNCKKTSAPAAFQGVRGETKTCVTCRTKKKAYNGKYKAYQKNYQTAYQKSYYIKNKARIQARRNAKQNV